MKDSAFEERNATAKQATGKIILKVQFNSCKYSNTAPRLQTCNGPISPAFESAM